MANFNKHGTRRRLTWAALFPEGRELFYEGDDLEGFCAEMKEVFGFDPSEGGGWGEWIEYTVYTEFVKDGSSGFQSYPFFCPSEHLDAVYNGDYPVGS